MDFWFSSDIQFHYLYPPTIQRLAKRHWTPLDVVGEKVVQFLAPKEGARILDIGSGVGKFCLAGAYYKRNAFFYGVEQRKDLVEHAWSAQKAIGLSNVSFIHQNFTNRDFKKYDHFYFYNSFYENVKGTPKIDYNIPFSETLYNYYNRFLFKRLEEMPAGTRVVTRCSWEDRVPPSYTVVDNDPEKMLKFHIKE